MARERYDLVAIGSGPAGEKGAAQAAYFGKRVAIIEQGEVGGFAANTGTLPSKVLRETAVHVASLLRRDLYGLRRAFDEKLTPKDLFYREREVVESYRTLVRENISRHQIDYFEGRGSITDAHTVRVDLRSGGVLELATDSILIATGSRPLRPPEVTFDNELIFDSDTILTLKRLPGSLIVIGGGIVGCEYACLFQALGIPTALIDRDSILLPFLDDEIAQLLWKHMIDQGIDLRLDEDATHIDRHGDSVHVGLRGGSEVEADALLFTGGRVGNTESLGLQALGIEMDRKGRVIVNDRYQTSVPNIMAAGDVIGFPALAATSMEQGRVAICHAFGFEYKTKVSSLIPYAVYTIPEVSMVGITEEQLREQGQRYAVGRGYYRSNARGQISGDTGGLLKLVFDLDTQELLGVHIIGERASELIHIGQACMYFNGTIDFFIQNIFNFPTLSDVYKYAAYDGLGNVQRASG